jgi:hypothetical protein
MLRREKAEGFRLCHLGALSMRWTRYRCAAKLAVSTAAQAPSTDRADGRNRRQDIVERDRQRRPGTTRRRFAVPAE